LAVEVDGKYHETQKDFDSDRDSILKELGVRTLRIKNEELENISAVLSKIKEALTHSPSPSLFQKAWVTEPKNDTTGSKGTADKKLFEDQQPIANPLSPSLQSSEGVTSRSEVGGESGDSLTHSPSPSLFQSEGVTELKSISANSGGAADKKFLEGQKLIANPLPPSLQNREGVASPSEVGGEFNQTHPPSPSLFQSEGVTELKNDTTGSKGTADKKLFEDQQPIPNPLSPSLQSREGVASRSEVGGESGDSLTHPPSPSLFQSEGVTELKSISANSGGTADKKFLEGQKLIANPLSPSLQSREGVASQREAGGEFVQEIATSIHPLTHSPSPSLFQKAWVTEPKNDTTGSKGTADKKLFEDQQLIANPLSPSLQSREGVTSRSEVGGESGDSLTHPPSPSLFQSEGTTEPKNNTTGSKGIADNFFFEGQKPIANPLSPSLQSREGVASQREAGGESRQKITNLSILLLAAGSSSRLGSSKQLLLLNGESLLYRTTSLSLQVTDQVTVALGSNFQSHFPEISHLPVQIVENEQWKNGMGHSLKTGLTALLKKWPHTSAVIVLVCDQPLLTASHLENLIEVARTSDKPIVSSCYKNVLGVPALFKKELFAELLALGDSEGARKLIQQKKNEVEAVDFPGGEIDLDTPEDVKRFLG